MARAKWLSDEERDKILSLHQQGVSAAEIARRMQRGAKSIQRVLQQATERHPRTVAPTIAEPVVSTVSQDQPEDDDDGEKYTSSSRDNTIQFATPPETRRSVSRCSDGWHQPAPATATGQKVAPNVFRQSPHDMVGSMQRTPADDPVRRSVRASSPNKPTEEHRSLAHGLVHVIPNYDEEEDCNSATLPSRVQRPPRLSQNPNTVQFIHQESQPGQKTNKRKRCDPTSGLDLVQFNREVSSAGSSVSLRRSEGEMECNNGVSQLREVRGDSSLQHALQFLQDTITQMRTSDSGIFEERIRQLFLRFRADVRLLELERVHERATGSFKATWTV